MLAFSVREAIRDAVAAFGAGGIVAIDSPCTPERIFWAIQEAKRKSEAYAASAAGAVHGDETVEILRAAIFHTPRDPFDSDSEDALVYFADGALAIANGGIAACGDYAELRRGLPDAAVRDLRGSFIVPGMIDTHIHFPQVRIVGGLGYSLLGWLEKLTPPRNRGSPIGNMRRKSARISGPSRHARNHEALVFGAFRRAMERFFEAAALSGLRIVSGLVLSDRGLSSRTASNARAGLSRKPIAN